MEKTAYTAGAVILYALASQVPLYGLPSASTADPLYLVRSPLGATSGSLMSLGVLPVILSSFVAQFGLRCGFQSPLLHARFEPRSRCRHRFDVTFKDQRQLYNSYSKFLGIVFSFCAAGAPLY